MLLKWVTPLKWVFIHSHTLTRSFSRSRDAVPRVLSVVVMWRRLLRCHDHICMPAETCMHLAGASVAVASKVDLIFKHDLSQNEVQCCHCTCIGQCLILNYLKVLFILQINNKTFLCSVRGVQKIPTRKFFTSSKVIITVAKKCTLFCTSAVNATCMHPTLL